MKSIIILGAGFGGIQTALSLGRLIKRNKLTELYKIVLIDKNTYHTFSPTLYEIATTSDYIASTNKLRKIVTLPIDEIFAGLQVNFLQEKVASVDINNKEIKFESGTILEYGWLVLSLGGQTNFFGIPGLTQYSLPLKTFNDALRIREAILQKIENDDRDVLDIVIGGGGPTGVELAGEISLLTSALPRVACGACKPTVTIIDGGVTVLSAFDKKIVTASVKRLNELGVSLRNSERIRSVEEKTILLESGKKFTYDILIWTGGVSAHQIMNTLPLIKDQSGNRIMATEEMLCLPHNEDLTVTKNIYGIGDAICFIDPKTHRPTPGVARVAILQGRISAHNIGQQILAEQNKIKTAVMKTFKPKSYPYILPIGGKFAVAKFGPFLITGILAWFIKGLVELGYFFSILKPHKALKYWLSGLWIFLRNNKMG